MSCALKGTGWQCLVIILSEKPTLKLLVTIWNRLGIFIFKVIFQREQGGSTLDYGKIVKRKWHLDWFISAQWEYQRGC